MNNPQDAHDPQTRIKLQLHMFDFILYETNAQI